MLRQQADHADSRPNRCLADFVAPAETGLTDHVGAFAVAIQGADELADRFQAELDDYRSIMVRALADRLAEAFASGSTSKLGTSGTRRGSGSPVMRSSASASGGSAPRMGTPPARTTRRSRRS